MNVQVTGAPAPNRRPTLRTFFVRWLANLVAILLMTQLRCTPGIQIESQGWSGLATLAAAAAVLAAISALLRPLLVLLTLPLQIVTLGLFTFVINGFLLWLTSKLVTGFVVQGAGSAIGGGLVLSLVGLAVGFLTGEGARVEVRMGRRPGADQ